MSTLSVNEFANKLTIPTGIDRLSVEEPTIQGTTTFDETYTVPLGDQIVSIGTIQIQPTVTVTVNGTWRFI